jgi:hypothetical protein
MKSSLFLNAVLGVSGALAQMTCPQGLLPGRDEVIFTIPYTYTQAMSIIGSYQNLTWSGSPEGSVSLDGPDNTVGTTRTYDIAGAHVVEKITVYQKPAAGPYVEIHTLALLSIPSVNVSFSAPYDGTTVTSICDGKASTFNFTALFCASNVTVAQATLHQIHLTDAQTVGVFLGGKNFTSCAALASSSGSSTATMAATKTASATPASFTGAGAKSGNWVVHGGVFVATLCVAALML